jgi:hypothetical protein
VCLKDCEGNERFRDDVEGVNVQMKDDVEDTSVHDVQDEGEGCERVLKLSAKDKM